MIKITFNTCPRTGKESCKLFGSPTEFTDFMEHALKLEGSWTQTKDPENHKIFKADNAAISWWNSTKTLSISRKRENEIRKQLKALVQKGKSEVDHTYNISQEDISSDQPPLHQSTTADTHNSNGYQQEFKNIWAALHTLFTNNVNTGSDIFSITQQERSANQKVNEEIRILLREDISLKTDNHHLNEKIKELESTLKSYQEPGERIKPK